MLKIIIQQPTLGEVDLEAQGSGDLEIRSTSKYLEILHADRWGDEFPTCSMFEAGSYVKIQHDSCTKEIFG